MVNLQLLTLSIVSIVFLIKVRSFSLFLYLIFIVACYIFPVLLDRASTFYGWELLEIEIDYENALLFVLIFLIFFISSYENFKLKKKYYEKISNLNCNLIIFYYSYIVLYFLYLVKDTTNFFIFTFPFFLWSFIYYIKFKTINNNLKFIILLYSIGLFFYLYLSIIDGTRWQIFLCLILYFLIIKPGINLKNISYFTVCIISLLPFFPILMDLRVGREISIFNSEIDYIFWTFGDIFVDRLNYSRVLGLVMSIPLDIEGGSHYLNNIIGLIPRWLWEDKPILGLNLNQIGHDLLILQYSDTTTSIGLSNIGESYALLGWWGLVNAIPLGVIFKIGQIYLEIFNPVSKLIGAIIIIVILTAESLTYILPTLILCLSPVFICFIFSIFLNYLYQRVFCDLFIK